MKLNFDDLFQVAFGQAIENDDLINAVEKFRPKMRAQRICHQTGTRFFRFFLSNVLRTDVGGHNDDRVLKIDRSPLPVRDPTVIEHLQQYVENVRMRFFDFVEEHDRIRLAPNCFGKLPPFFVADVARRSAD